MEVELLETDSVWKPMRLRGSLVDQDETADLYKKVRSILNKLTPVKFYTLVQQLQALPINNSERMHGVVDLVFEKAISEPMYSAVYARLCKVMSDMQVVDGAENGRPVIFRQLLLSRCLHEFEKNDRADLKRDECLAEIESCTDPAVDEPSYSVAYAQMCEVLSNVQVADGSEEGQPDNLRELLLSRRQHEFEKNAQVYLKRGERLEEIEQCTDPEKKKELQLEFKETERRLQMKPVGNIRFVGELFKLGMLTSNIMHRCIQNLLKQRDEVSLECLCKLLMTIGKDLESKKDDLSKYFEEIKVLSKQRGQISSRVRFVLQDVIELRDNKWVPRQNDSAPKTIDQIQCEAERESMMEMQMPSRGGGGSHGGGGGGRDNRGSDRRKCGGPIEDGWQSVQKKNLDTSKLRIRASDLMNISLGRSNQFAAWTQGGGGNSDSDHNSAFPHTSKPFAALLDVDDKKRGVGTLSRPFGKQPPSSNAEREKAVNSLHSFVSAEKEKSRARMASSGTPSRSSSREGSSARQMPALSSSQSRDDLAAGTRPVASGSSAVSDQDTRKNLPHLNLGQVVEKVQFILEEFVNNNNFKKSALSVSETFPPSNMGNFVGETMYVLLVRSAPVRSNVGKLMGHLVKEGILTTEQFLEGFKDIVEVADDLPIGVPKVWLYLAEILVPMLSTEALSFSDLKTAATGLHKLVVEILRLLVKEKNPGWIWQRWDASGLSWKDFAPADSIDRIVKENKLEFTVDNSPALAPRAFHAEVPQMLRLEQGPPASTDEVTNWISERKQKLQSVCEKMKRQQRIKSVGNMSWLCGKKDTLRVTDYEEAGDTRHNILSAKSEECQIQTVSKTTPSDLTGSECRSEAQTPALLSLGSCDDAATVDSDVSDGDLSQLCPDRAEEKIRLIMEEFLSSNNIQESVLSISEEFPPSDMGTFVVGAVTFSLEQSASVRSDFGNLMSHLLAEGVLTTQQLLEGLKEVARAADALGKDMPEVWLNMAEILVSVVSAEVLSSSDMKTATKGLHKMISTILHLLQKEKGPDWISQRWDLAGINWKDFSTADSKGGIVKESAVSDSTNSAVYAQVCEALSDVRPRFGGKEGCRKFRGLPLRPCRHEFENNWLAGLERERHLAEMEMCTDPDPHQKVRALLNKLRPENFHMLMKQLEIVITDNSRELPDLVDLVFEKAVSDSTNSAVYAQVCEALSDVRPRFGGEEGCRKFRGLLLRRCRHEFENNWLAGLERERHLAEMEMCTDPVEREKMQSEMDTYLQMKYVGFIRFVGELFKLGMLTQNVMHRYIQGLLNQRDEVSLECLCELLTAVGKRIDGKEREKERGIEKEEVKEAGERVDGERTAGLLSGGTEEGKEGEAAEDTPHQPVSEQIHGEGQWSLFNPDGSKKYGRDFLIKLRDTPEAKKKPEIRSVLTFLLKDNIDRPRLLDLSRGPHDNLTRTFTKCQSYQRDLSKYFEEIKVLLKQSGQISSRVRFMLQNVIELRDNNWVPQSDVSTQKTIEQCNAERESTIEMQMQSRGGGGSCGIGRGNQGGDWRNSAEKEERRARTASSGTPSRSSSREGSSARHTPAPSSSQSRDDLTAGTRPVASGSSAVSDQDTRKNLPHLNLDPVAKKIHFLLEEFVNNNNFEESALFVSETFPPSNMDNFVIETMNILLERSAPVRSNVGKLMAHLMKEGILTTEQFLEGFKAIAEVADDLAIDVPKVWLSLAEILVSMLSTGALSFSDLKTAATGLHKLVVEILRLLVKEKSPGWIRQRWDASGLSWKDFAPAGSIDRIVKENKLEFTVGDSLALAPEAIHAELLQMLQPEQGPPATTDEVTNWISVNVGDRAKTPEFIRVLTTAVCECVYQASSSKKFEEALFTKYVSLLQRHIDTNEELELHCLYAVQELNHRLEQPSGLLCSLFQSLWDYGCVANETFLKWEQSKDPAFLQGKGIALESLTAFFTALREADDDSSEECTSGQ